MMNSRECCAGSHQGEPRRPGFYSCFADAAKTYSEAGIKACEDRFARGLLVVSGIAKVRRRTRSGTNEGTRNASINEWNKRME
jgi:hypothetical protein